jgi:hypothetical protein
LRKVVMLGFLRGDFCFPSYTSSRTSKTPKTERN